MKTKKSVTKRMKILKDGTLKAGQIANLRINDSIKVEYDLETKDVQLITITIKK